MVVGPFRPATRRAPSAVSALAVSSAGASVTAGAGVAVASAAASLVAVAPQAASETHRAAAATADINFLNIVYPPDSIQHHAGHGALPSCLPFRQYKSARYRRAHLLLRCYYTIIKSSCRLPWQQTAAAHLPSLRQHRTIPALRLKHRSGSCGTASALPKCSIIHKVLFALLA